MTATAPASSPTPTPSPPVGSTPLQVEPGAAGSTDPVQAALGAPAVPPRLGPPGGGVDLDQVPSISAVARRRNAYGASGVDRTNRGVLGVLGLVVAVAGGGALLLSQGTLHWSTTPGSLYRRMAVDALDHAGAATAVAVAACVMVAAAGIWWALAQLRPVTAGPRLGTVALSEDARGRTTLAAAAAGRAASADLATQAAIASARVRIVALAPRPRAVVSVAVAAGAGPDQLRAALSGALGRLASALGAPTVDAEVRVRFVRAGTGRPARTLA